MKTVTPRASGRPNIKWEDKTKKINKIHEIKCIVDIHI